MGTTTLTLAAVAASMTLLAACATERAPIEASASTVVPAEKVLPIHLSPSKVTVQRPVVALALGGGGLRGYAHIGVLQAMEAAGVRIDVVAGTSIGALVGAAYASGLSPREIWTRAEAKNLLSLADVTLFGPGFVKGSALARWANALVAGALIEDFPRRFVAVATDLDGLAPVVLDSGDAGQAVRASAAIPGVFLPVDLAGRQLVDGGVTSLVPVRAARSAGADVVIAVDIYCNGAKYPTTSVASTWLRVSQVQSCLLSRAELADADVVIAPAVSPGGINDASGQELARRKGYEAAMAALPAVQAAIRARSNACEQ